MAGRLRKPPVMGGFFQRRENEVEIDNKINLGFSGGGFRATFYCLGAYRRLVELGLEKHVNEITSVSGGSIAAGAVISALAEGDFSSLLDFDRRVTTKLINLGQCKAYHDKSILARLSAAISAQAAAVGSGGCFKAEDE